MAKKETSRVYAFRARRAEYDMTYVTHGPAKLARIAEHEVVLDVYEVTYVDTITGEESTAMEEKVVSRDTTSQWNSKEGAKRLYQEAEVNAHSPTTPEQQRLRHVYYNSYTKGYMLSVVDFMKGHGL